MSETLTQKSIHQPKCQSTKCLVKPKCVLVNYPASWECFYEVIKPWSYPNSTHHGPAPVSHFQRLLFNNQKQTSMERGNGCALCFNSIFAEWKTRNNRGRRKVWAEIFLPRNPRSHHGFAQGSTHFSICGISSDSRSSLHNLSISFISACFEAEAIWTGTHHA